MNEVRDMWETRWITTMGPKHQKLEKALAEYLAADNVSVFASGHTALEMVIQAMGLTGEVITTPFTFASTTHAIVRSGLTPVFCDIRMDDYNIDVSRMEALITDKTTAVIPVHVYGNVCQVEAIKELADRYHLKIIYDAAHAFGVRYKGRGIASFGDASVFSFHASKVFNTIEGGAVACPDRQYADRLACIRNFGVASEESVPYAGGNGKMNEFEAAMGLCNLRHIEEEIAWRRAVDERYREHLENIDGIRLNRTSEDTEYNYAYFPVLIDEKKCHTDRNALYDLLHENHICARKHFYPLTSEFECYKGRFQKKDTPVAKYVSERILSLPLYAGLKLETVDEICRIIKNAV